MKTNEIGEEAGRVAAAPDAREHDAQNQRRENGEREGDSAAEGDRAVVGLVVLWAIDEAERVRRAKVIHANGEVEASERLTEAAAKLSEQPQAIQLRYLQTLSDLANDRSSVIVFPVPIDLLGTLSTRAAQNVDQENT